MISRRAESPGSRPTIDDATAANCRLSFASPPVVGLVSVVIPTYNRRSSLVRAVESVIAQTYENVEVIVADDGSTDDSAAALRCFGPRVTCVRQANRGVSAARNLGMRHARGELIAFLDSDDSWAPWKLEAQTAALARFPDAGVVWTDMTAVDERGAVVHDRYLRAMYGAYSRVDIGSILRTAGTLGTLIASVPTALSASVVRMGNIFGALLLGNLLHTSTVLFRRELVERTGGFDETFARAGEDYEFYVRLCSSGPVVMIDAPTVRYRIGAPDQLSAPAMMLEIARNNLRTVERWLPHSAVSTTLSDEVVQRRIADSLAWAGETELDAGHRIIGARRLVRSLATRPRIDRRAVLLVRCALPRRLTQALTGTRDAIASLARRRAMNNSHG